MRAFALLCCLVVAGCTTSKPAQYGSLPPEGRMALGQCHMAAMSRFPHHDGTVYGAATLDGKRQEYVDACMMAAGWRQ